MSTLCVSYCLLWRTPIYASISQDTKGMATVAGLEQGWVFQTIPYETLFNDALHQVCGLPQWQTLPSPLYLPEEEQEQESDGVLLLVHVCEVPPRVVELHRPRLYVHPREAKADKTDNHFLSVLQRRFRYFNTWLNLLVLEGEYCELIVGSRYPVVHGRRC